jgi:hypothetical protein
MKRILFILGILILAGLAGGLVGFATMALAADKPRSVNMRLTDQSQTFSPKHESLRYEKMGCTHVITTQTAQGMTHFACLRLYEGE